MNNERWKTFLCGAALATLLGSLAASTGAAATINVPADQPTIQLGINAAGAGDVVLVAPGVYPEAVVIAGKTNLTLRGSGLTVTTIQAPATGPAVRVNNSTGITITGFRLSSDIIGGDDYDGGAIRILDSSTIRIFKNLITRHHSNGIVLYGSDIEVFNNVIAQVGDDGIRLEAFNSVNANRAVIYNNTIADNRGGSGVGIWLRRQIDTATAFNNIVYENDYNIGLEGASVFAHDYNLIAGSGTDFFGFVARNPNEPACNPAFLNPPLLDYHIPAGSCAENAGTASFNGKAAPADDIDGNLRPSSGGIEIGADEIAITLVCEPHTQGYWHRQCMGIDAIRPGQGNGPGPHPGFLPEEFLDLILVVNGQLAFSGQTTCEALDADPPSDPCERALKQYAAMLLNVAAGYLSPQCPVQIRDAPGTVGGLIPHVQSLIQAGQCKRAASICASVNEGEALVSPAASAIATVPISRVERLVGTVSAAPARSASNQMSPPGAEAAVTGVRADGTGPERLRLAIHPNPGLAHEIHFALPRRANVELGIYDLSGRRIAVVASGAFDAGTYDLEWDGRTMDDAVAGPGMYFCKLRAGGEVLTARMIRVR